MPSFGGVVLGVVARLQAASIAVARRFLPFSARFVIALDAPISRPIASEQPLSPQSMPRQMSVADQWSKISTVLVRSVDSARCASEMQIAATQQLDLAQYGLLTLVDELSSVMTIPGRRSRSATVHAFNGMLSDGPRAATGHALAA